MPPHFQLINSLLTNGGERTARGGGEGLEIAKSVMLSRLFKKINGFSSEIVAERIIFTI